jgi:hypothetical protein
MAVLLRGTRSIQWIVTTVLLRAVTRDCEILSRPEADPVVSTLIHSSYLENDLPTPRI